MSNETDKPWRRPVRRATPRPERVDRVSARPTFEEAVEVMLRRSGWAPNTQQAARQNLLGGRLTDFRAAHGIVHVDEFTTDHAAEWLADCAEDGLAPATLVKAREMLIALQRFCASTPGFGSALERVEATVAKPRIPLRQVDVLTPAEEVAVLRACDNDRDRMMVEVMLMCGLRRGELVALQLPDLHLDEARPYLAVRRSHGRPTTKGYRDRTVPLNWAGGNLAKRLARYVERRPPSYRLEVFLSLRADRNGDYPALLPNAVNSLFARLEARTGLHLHPHALRHTWATRAANAGVPMPLLQEAGGWQSLAMVSRYFTAERDAMLEAFGRAHRA